MGRMTAPQSSRTKRKSRFLNEYRRIGTVSRASRAARVSPDAVYDWLKKDESFARQFQHAKAQYKNEPFRSVDSTVIFISDVIRPLISRDAWPRVAAAIAIAVANLKNDLQSGRRLGGPRSAEVSGVFQSSKRFVEVDIPSCDCKTSANDL